MRVTGKCAALAISVAVLSSLPVWAADTPFFRQDFEISKEDRGLQREAAKKLYTNPSMAVGDKGEWMNENTGNKGAVEIILLHQERGLDCVRLKHDIRVKNVSKTFRYIVDRCKTAKGEWKLL